MVQTIKSRADMGLMPFVVTRAICIAGERIEVGATVELNKVQGSELAAASKVAPAGSAAADAAIASAKPAKEPKP